MIDTSFTEDYHLQNVLAPLPDKACAIMKMHVSKPVNYNHVFYYLKDSFASQLVGIVIDPFSESKIAFVAFKNADLVEKVRAASTL